MPIVRNETICFNQPILKGRRLTVYNIISSLYHADYIDEYINDFEITHQDVREAIRYCKNTLCNEFKNSNARYCDGCILRTISEGKTVDINTFSEQGLTDKITVSNDGKFIFLGSKEELENSEFGSIGWEMAENVEKKFFPDDSPSDVK